MADSVRFLKRTHGPAEGSVGIETGRLRQAHSRAQAHRYGGQGRAPPTFQNLLSPKAGSPGTGRPLRGRERGRGQSRADVKAILRARRKGGCCLRTGGGSTGGPRGNRRRLFGTKNPRPRTPSSLTASRPLSRRVNKIPTLGRSGGPVSGTSTFPRQPGPLQ